MEINLKSIPYRELGHTNGTFIDFIEGNLPSIQPPVIEDLDKVLEKRKKFYDSNPQRLKDLLSCFKSAELTAPQKKNLDYLSQSNTFAVIGGQQTGLLTGPLYTLYKIITVLYLSEKLNRSRHERFVPVFWAATQDHDLVEIEHCNLLGKDNSLHKFHWPWNEKYPDYMSGSVPLEPELPENLLTFCREHIRETEFREDILGVLEDTFARSQYAGEWFIAILNRLFGDYGLLVFDSRWSEKAASIQPLLIKELDGGQKESISSLLMEGGRLFLSTGQKPPIHKLADITGFFLCKEGRRFKVTFKNNGYSSDIGFFTKEELLDAIERGEISWNGNAAFRPLIQDTLFPTAISVVGPTEYTYHGQLKLLYEKWNIPQPVVMPRISMTLVEPKISRKLNKIGLEPEDFLKDISDIEKSLIKSGEGAEIEKITDELEQRINDSINNLKNLAEDIDTTLLKSVEKQGNKLKQNVSQLNDLLIRKMRQNNESLRSQLEICRTALFPENNLQERSLNLVQMLCYYGPGLISELINISRGIETKQHFWISLSS